MSERAKDAIGVILGIGLVVALLVGVYCGAEWVLSEIRECPVCEC